MLIKGFGGGLLLGLVLGAANLMILNFSVRRPGPFRHGAAAVFFIAITYLARYAMIGGAIWWLTRARRWDAILGALAVLAVLTVGLALLRGGRCRAPKKPGFSARPDDDAPSDEHNL